MSTYSPLSPDHRPTPKPLDANQSRDALIVHGPGRVTHVAARELAAELEQAGWSTQVEHVNPGEPATNRRVGVVVGVDADVASFRAAAHADAPVLTTTSSNPHEVKRALDTADLDTRTSPIGSATIDRDAPTPIVQRAIVTPLDPDVELVSNSPIAQHIPLERIKHIAVDIPEPIDRGPGSRSSAAEMGAVMTFRSAEQASSVLLHPDDSYMITTLDGSDLVVHIDQIIHRRARCVELSAHPVGLRVVNDPASTTN